LNLWFDIVLNHHLSQQLKRIGTEEFIHLIYILTRMAREKRFLCCSINPQASNDGGAGSLKQLATTSGSEENGWNFKQEG
jgi:hypothetical protein